MSPAEDEWIKKNTFYCPTLRLKITPEKCAYNRVSYTPIEKHVARANGIFLNPKPEQCKKCRKCKTYYKRVGFSLEDEINHKLTN